MGFSVTRLSQSFVGPAEPTPSEQLKLSVIDRVPGLRHTVRSLHVFEHGQHPAKVIREALAKALVQYYPFAGRFVRSEEGEVVVECTGEGAWFVEAAADCSLEDVKYLDHPLMTSQDELLPYPRPEAELLNLPVMMQVTEFKCGGFVVGTISIHTIADGLGAAQFIKAIGDLARGHPGPTVNPIWSRHLIPNPPKLPPASPPVFPSLKLLYSNFHLSPDYITKIKSIHFDLTGRHCSTFDISIATVWQARTRALKLDPQTPVQLCFFANTRHLLTPQALLLEGGFYGNCFYPVIVTAQSGDIVNAELVDVVRLIRYGKARLPDEFARWARGGFVEDPYELEITYNTLFVSDWTQLGFLEVDYGWGKPVHVIPFAYFDFMAVAILGRPMVPRKGAWLTTQCVEEEHLLDFEKHMSRFS